MYLIVDLSGGLDFVTDDLDKVDNWEEACEVGDMEIYNLVVPDEVPAVEIDNKFTISRWNGNEFVNV